MIEDDERGVSAIWGDHVTDEECTGALPIASEKAYRWERLKDLMA